MRYDEVKKLDEAIERMDAVIKSMEKVVELAQEGLVRDGAHHKQWYLEQIIKEMGEHPVDHDEGIAP